MSLAQRILNLDRRWIWVFMLVAFILPVIQPFAIPVPISRETRIAYDKIESMPAGSIIGVDCSLFMRFYPELGPSAVAFIKQTFRKNLKMIVWSIDTPEGAPFWEMALTQAKPVDKTYGVDWVNLGFIAGLEAAEASIMRDIHGTVPTDYFGNRVADLPLTKNVNNSKDLNLVVVMIANQPDDRVRQYAVGAHQPFICISTIAWTPGMKPYVAAGQIITTVGGVIGGAEWESLVKSPGRGLASTDIISSIVILTLTLTVLCNVGYLASYVKTRGK